MSYETLFTLANAVAGLCWLPLIVAPHTRFTQRISATPAAPLVFALAYVALVGVMVATPGEGGMDSLASLRAGFARDSVLLLGWVHYLCFDMLVGFWEVRDSHRLGLSPWLVAPCLLFTFLLGPTGLVLYLGLRWATRRTFTLDSKAEQ